MLSLRLAVGFAAVSLLGSNSIQLQVIRATPESPADPLTDVTITFDRPVAGGLDESVDAASIFRIEPAVDGRIEWRDPLTLRFSPVQPLVPGQTYQVTVTTGFAAMDGSALEQPYVHTFTVSEPRVLASYPVTGDRPAMHVSARPELLLLLSAPVDPATFATRAAVRLDRACGGGTVALRVVAQRRISNDDPSWFRWTGLRGPMPDSARDLRRVVVLQPVSPLPLDCAATLAVPADARSNATLTSWRFRTYGPLRLSNARCALTDYCATGPIQLQFSTPVRGSEIARRVRIIPAREFTVRDTLEEATDWILDVALEPRTTYAVAIGPGLTDVFGQPFQGRALFTFATTGYAPTIVYDYGRLLVEREGLRTLAVQHVNIDTLWVKTAIVPDSLVPVFLGRTWGWEEPWTWMEPSATLRKVAVQSGRDERRVTGVGSPGTELEFAL